MNKKILNPYWGDEAKTQIVCEFEYDDGTSLTASVMNTKDGEDNNPDWDQVLKEHTIKSIDKTTNGKLEVKSKNEDVNLLQVKNDKEKNKNEDIFQAKIDAFQIEEVKESKDRALKAKIRKAKTLTEVIAYSTILIMKASETPTTTTKAKAKKK
jgi:hypothetical protein